MTRARQHAARLRHQRKYVPRLTQVLRPGIRRYRGLDRVRAIMRGYPRGHAFGGLDRQGEVGAMRAVGIAYHERQAQLAAALARQGEADEAAPIARHEVHVLRTNAIRCHDEVAFIFAILVVHDHGHFTEAQVLEDFVDCIERGHWVLLFGFRHEPFQISGDRVDFDVDAVADSKLAKRGDRKGMGNDIDVEATALDLIDGQADAIDANRALGSHETHQGWG